MPGLGLVEWGRAEGHACGAGGGLWAEMCEGTGGEGI